MLDVGSGGGVPGVVLAIVRPDLSITLSDSVGKKAKVLEDIVARLGLKTPVFHGPAQEALAKNRFDTLTVRAVAPLKKLLEWFKPHWNAFDSAVGPQRPGLGRRTRRSPAFRPAEEPRAAQIEELSAARHRIGKRVVVNRSAAENKVGWALPTEG